MLPPYKQTSMRFLRDFLKGEKELLKAAEVRHFNVPLYPELTVVSLLEVVKRDPAVMLYLPVYEGQRDPPDREFFFGVLGSVAPVYLSGIIKHANRVRNRDDGERPREELIEVRRDLFTKLETEPFFSRKDSLLLPLKGIPCSL
jgi:hypothetical protein